MQNIRFKEKVNVFISSNCGEKYTLVREALRLLLLETGMCEVYMFEEEGATTSDVVSSYMRRLERVDIIIFLIDNKDGINEGTMREVKRGRELKKKSIFLFCNEKEKKETELQKEIISMLNGEKFKVVSEFVKLPEIAYESVINDIIDTYLSYCHDRVQSMRSEVETEDFAESARGDIHTILNKEAFGNCDYTKWVLNCEVSHEQEYTKKINTFDRLCSDLFSVILGNKTIEDVDFDGIKRYVKDMHESGNFQKAIMLRMDAMETYWKGEIKETIKILVKALDIAMKTKKIPRWFVNDIAIDLRNINIINNQESNINDYCPKGQDVIEESDEPLFFPVVDRFSSNFYEKVSNNMLDNATASPFVVKFGGISYVLDKIVDIYIAALLYGSIVHTVLIRDKIVLYLQGCCLEYREPKILITTIKLLLLQGNEKKMSKFIEAYGGYTDSINSENIKDLIDAVSRIKIKYKRVNSSNILLNEFGYYLSDKEFEAFYKNLQKEFKIWMDEPYASDLIVKGYLTALEKNQYRISQNDFLEIAYCFYEKGFKRWYDDIFRLLSRIEFKNIEEIQIKKYLLWLIECANNDEISKEYHNLPLAMENVRLQRDDASLLDKVVETRFNEFYIDEYSLNVFENDLKETNIHINRYIEIIESQNKTQGCGGYYSGYTINPYIAIENILTLGKVKVPIQEIDKILKAVKGTLKAEKQTIESKIDAWRLITIIFMIYPNAECIQESLEDIENNIEIFLHGKYIFLVHQYNENSLQVSYQFFKIFTNQSDELNVIEAFSNITKNGIPQIIILLKMLYCLLTEADRLGVSIMHIKYMLQSLLEFSRNQNSDVRFYAYISLIKIMNISKECSELILSRLSEAMDGETYKNKVAILSRLSSKNDKKVEYIISKGRVDNHFWVRDIARR